MYRRRRRRALGDRINVFSMPRDSIERACWSAPRLPSPGPCMDTLLATERLPRWRFERGHRHHAPAAFLPPVQEKYRTLPPSRLSPEGSKNGRKGNKGNLSGNNCGFLKWFPPRQGHHGPGGSCPCGSPRPLAITIANGIRLPFTLCRWGGKGISRAACLRSPRSCDPGSGLPRARSRSAGASHRRRRSSWRRRVSRR